VSEKEALIRLRLTELVAYRDGNARGLTQQAMADTLNTEGIASLSSKPWSTHSIRRTLKKFDLHPPTRSMRPGQTVRKATPPPEQPPEQPEEVVEHRLKHTSPLMQWNYYESVRDIFEELTGKHHSVKTLIKKLDKMGAPTADGSAWDESAVSRVLKVLQPTSAVHVGVSDDVIRERIKEGWYDTEEESFICVRKKPEKRKKSKKSKNKLRSSEHIEQKNKTKTKKKEKKPKKGKNKKK